MGIAAILSSQVLAQLSTVRNADGLICRVRNESGSFPVAMAAMPNEIIVISLYKACKENALTSMQEERDQVRRELLPSVIPSRPLLQLV